MGGGGAGGWCWGKVEEECAMMMGFFTRLLYDEHRSCVCIFVSFLSISRDTDTWIK